MDDGQSCSGEVKGIIDNVVGIAIDMLKIGSTGTTDSMFDMMKRTGNLATELANSICENDTE